MPAKPVGRKLRHGYELLPIISLWMPWANWIMLGWKPIETRTHNRFKSLAGKRIGIHASLKWDTGWLQAAEMFLSDWQANATKAFLRIGGGIVGTAYVSEYRECSAEDSKHALIDCANVKRYGLVLTAPKIMPLIPLPGKQGIWYEEIPSDPRVSK